MTAITSIVSSSQTLALAEARLAADQAAKAAAAIIKTDEAAVQAAMKTAAAQTSATQSTNSVDVAV